MEENTAPKDLVEILRGPSHPASFSRALLQAGWSRAKVIGNTKLFCGSKGLLLGVVAKLLQFASMPPGFTEYVCCAPLAILGPGFPSDLLQLQTLKLGDSCEKAYQAFLSASSQMTAEKVTVDVST